MPLNRHCIETHGIDDRSACPLGMQPARSPETPRGPDPSLRILPLSGWLPACEDRSHLDLVRLNAIHYRSHPTSRSPLRIQPTSETSILGCCSFRYRQNKTSADLKCGLQGKSSDL